MQISAAGRISRRAKWTEIRHASACAVGTSHTTGMLDSLILILFVISGAAAGWLGVDLLPEQQLIRSPTLEQLTWILAAVGAAAGLVAGLVFAAPLPTAGRERRGLARDAEAAIAAALGVSAPARTGVTGSPNTPGNPPAPDGDPPDG